MTDGVNTRELILQALLEINKDGAFSHVVLKNLLDKYSYLPKQERSFMKRVIQGTLEHQIELDAMINQVSKTPTSKMKPVIREILRFGVYQLKYMDSVPASAACNEAVKLAVRKGFGSLKGFVNGVMRNVSRNMSTMVLPDSLSIRYSMPEWITDMLVSQYGEPVTEEICRAFQEEPALSVRVNEAVISRQELKNKLTERGITVTDNPEIACGLFISHYDRPEMLPEFMEGSFYIQDTGSMMVGVMADVKAGDHVIDVCAAPGGKSMHIAEILKGTGMVSARDLTPLKVSLMEENRQRLGLVNMEVKQQDATEFDPDSEGYADVVIADLPCSGLGTIGRKPDIRYKLSQDSIPKLIQLQRRILDTVYSYVKPNGKLIYSTCTINKEENQDNAAYFLQKHPEFKQVSEQVRLPGKEHTDGFYLCVFQKTE